MKNLIVILKIIKLLNEIDIIINEEKKRSFQQNIEEHKLSIRLFH